MEMAFAVELREGNKGRIFDASEVGLRGGEERATAGEQMNGDQDRALLPTRASLLSRLRDVRQDGSWREFFDLYWKLIYNASRKRGLTATEAEEVVQETMINLMKEMPAFRYDPNKGSFKSWLMHITYRRIADQVRKRKNQQILDENIDVEADSDFERSWMEEWQRNLIETAVGRVRERTSPHAFQVYSLCVLQNKGVRATARILKMSVAGVYMASFKVNKLIKAEVEKIKAKEEA
jgi:RNA polymerase sigma-70 factor (ECF subfamily)